MIVVLEGVEIPAMTGQIADRTGGPLAIREVLARVLSRYQLPESSTAAADCERGQWSRGELESA